MYPLDLHIVPMADACPILDHIVAPDVCRCEPNVVAILYLPTDLGSTYLILFQLHNFVREFSLKYLRYLLAPLAGLSGISIGAYGNSAEPAEPLPILSAFLMHTQIDGETSRFSVTYVLPATQRKVRPVLVMNDG